MQRAAGATGEPGPVQEDTRALVFAGAVLGLAVVLVEFQVALAAQALCPELPVVVGQLVHRVGQPGAVVVVGQERTVRTTAVVWPARDGALAGGCAEYTRPARQQPGKVGRDQVLGIVRVVELHPLTGEVQLDFLPRVHRSPSRICHGFNVRPRSPPRDSAIAQHGRHMPPGALRGSPHARIFARLVCFRAIGRAGRG
ncbi:Uncharacterised protein [Mycobacterium tuberculosis]|nr:Uncharacterised protein [Mycobacterium tuberculosis]CKT28555.1 Uncharacterised protein [Mycobacterium tuberculosis]